MSSREHLRMKNGTIFSMRKLAAWSSAAALVCASLPTFAADPPKPDPKATAKPETKAEATPAAVSASTRPDPKAPPAANDYGNPVVKFVNEKIREQWKDYNLTPSLPATDGEWCRRVYLDVLGRVPSVQELRAFVASKEPNKKAKLVDMLLEDDAYTEEYARNWTTIWTNVLIGRAGGTEQNTLTSREGMQKYLRDSFARNKPYDRMVQELITATGSTMPGSDGFNGASNFLIMKLEESAAQATAKTSQIFLGMQVQCTQCHNHPFNDWKQQKFWEFNAFFRQTAAQRENIPGTNDVASANLIDQDFGGEGGTPEEAEIYYELRNGLLQVAYPTFVDGQPIAKSGYVSEVNRRKELAKLVVESKAMPEAIANRMWSHFFGYGFTKPIDDMGPHNQPTHPELLAHLGEQFREHSHNLKDLMRWITLSEAYSLSSRITKANEADNPAMGETPKFSHFYIRQMSAEQLYESLLVATQAHKSQGSYEEQEKTKGEWLRQFVVAFGNDEGLEATTFNGTIPQALMMFNGELIKKATSADNGSFLWTLANSKLKNPDKIRWLFNAGLARDPNNREVGVANALLAARTGDTAAALQDIWWAVLNSNEFIIVY